MTSDKRNFKDFDQFPGSINEGTGIYEFPTLIHIDARDRKRIWNIYLRIVKCDSDNKKESKVDKIDWNLLVEKQIPIKPSYIVENKDIPMGSAVEVWVETGIEGGKITRNIPTYFDKPAFVGHANQRNAFQQGLIYARSQYLKRMDKGDQPEGKASDQPEGKASRPSTTHNLMYFPMLAKSYKDGKKYIKFPLYVQPKLDGVRCLIFLKNKNGGVKNVVAYSRRKKEFPSVDTIKEILYPYLNDLYDEENNQSIYLDGELYKHGKTLQEISGDSRNENKANKNEYHIYDCFYPQELDTQFEDRHAQLNNLASVLKSADKEVIKIVPTYLVGSQKEVDSHFKKLTSQHYEGVILRNPKGEYLASDTKTGESLRSKDLVKLKKGFTDEFEVVGYTTGTRGKDVGAVIWIAVNDKGHQFKVTPKDSNYEERQKIYKECLNHFDKRYLGRFITVEYEDLSKNGIPLRAKSLTFRDYK
jgi:ATP-dependent DNA ligase